ncbi:MAG TPA: ketopantoate reductase family protein [Candidatus Bathyarchaeia archaeon]|nr:ketopantoate reductase family protein [Candidatus Bathyarchaeia archaeon]
MKFLILGAGSLGLIFGGMLDIAGHDVTLVARGKNYEALNNDGLTIMTPEGDIKRRLNVVSTPNSVEAADVAFLTVKSRDTESILSASTHLFGKTLFISLQNAAEKDELLSRYAGSSHVIGGVSTVGATLTEPGIVDYTAVGYNWLGEIPKGRSERVKEIVETLNQAGIPTDHAANITEIKWAKLIVYCANAGLASLTRLRTNESLQDPTLTAAFLKIVKEGGNVMKAIGLPPDNPPHLLPIKRILESQEDEIIQEFTDRARKSHDEERKVTVSMLQDVLNNKEIEVEETFGYIIKIAQSQNVEIPTLRIIYALLRGLNRHILNSSNDHDS